jgi:hypothetical protein
MTIGHNLVPIVGLYSAEDCPGEPPCGFMVRGSRVPGVLLFHGKYFWMTGWEIPTCI